MRAALALAVLLAGCGLLGCGTWESQERARTVAAEVMECPGATVEPIGDDRFHATGCGEEIDVACTSGGNEPRCERVRLRASGSAGGEIREIATAAGTETGAGRPGAGAGAPEGRAPEGRAPEGRAPEGRAPEGRAPEGRAPTADRAAESALRAAIDARAADVLACAGTDRVAVRVRTDANGAARVTLGGALAGRPEEGCVRAALADLTGPPSIEVIHLVRAP